MKVHHTQRLFWKKWPIKAIIEIKPTRDDSVSWTNTWRMSTQDKLLRREAFNRIERWCKNKFPESGIRKESNLSLFLNTEAELKELIDYNGHNVIEVWRPVNESAFNLLLEHSTDVVRAKPWYGKFTVRARIPYNSDFRNKGIIALRDALNNIEDDWHCAGLLMDAITSSDFPNVYGWGQPLNLYLSSSDDAAMLKLQCGEYIERFERIRKP